MKKDNAETLEEALRELMRHIRAISALEDLMNDRWGVTVRTGYIPSVCNDGRGDVMVQRGIEEIEKALGKEAKQMNYFRFSKELKYYGINFVQYADDKTKTFVKAGKKAPKVMIVEDEDGQERGSAGTDGPGAAEGF